MLESLRQEILQLNMELPKNNLVVWTSGNVSGRDPESGMVVIKPSGIMYEDLNSENMVVVDINGNVVEGELKPSSDTATHLYIYCQRPDIYGIVHTHSTFATAFAAVGRPIPAHLTAICDEFGGTIPVGELALIGNEDIGREVVRSIGNSKAVLMKNHGVFTIGKSARDALKAAVMVEDIARTMFYAYQLGEPLVIPPEVVTKLNRRYAEEYGQP